MRRGLKVVGTMAEVDRRLPQLIAELKPCYTSIQADDNNVIKLAPNKADAASLVKITDQLEAVIVALKAFIQGQEKAA